MGRLGYTLNGFYLVNGSDTVGRLGIAYCRFQFPQWADRSKDRVNTNTYGTDTEIQYYLIIIMV